MNSVKDSISDWCMRWNGSSEINSQDTVLKHFKEQEELKCDPLYLAVSLGIVHLLDLKMKKQQKEEATRVTQIGYSALQGIKISFGEDCSIHIAEPGFLSQSLSRRWSGQGRKELGYIRPHLVKLLRWFDYQADTYKTILKVCKCGIEAILEGYKHPQNQEILISQSEPPAPEQKKKASTTCITIQVRAPETDLVIRILENDIALLEEAIKDKDERQAQEFTARLNQEEKKYFPLYQLKLIKVAKTIDESMSVQVKIRWDGDTVQGIVKLFKAETKEAFNHYESLISLVSRTPEVHLALKMQVRELLASTLLNCTLLIKNLEAKEEEKISE